MISKDIAILHYSAPPIIGGVEAVIEAHAELFHKNGYPTAVIAGRGEQAALSGVKYKNIPLVDSQHPDILRISSELENGVIPEDFDSISAHLVKQLVPFLRHSAHLIVHNIFTKHFNLPLTSALHRMLDDDLIHHGIAWCHDISWTSPNSRPKMHPGYPWDLLRTQRKEITYVAVSELRQQDLAGLFECPADQIEVVYNGVEPEVLLGLSPGGIELITRLGLLDCDLILLMPVRVTQAKNIEYAMEVLASLKNHYKRPKLVLTGPPDPHDHENMAYFRSLLDLRCQLGLDADMSFVYESGPDPGSPLLIDSQIVGDLYRVSDVLFMPSHREGFGMPVLEAGLVGLTLISTNVPASQEIARENALVFELNQPPEEIAERLHLLVEGNPLTRMRRLVRTRYTWDALFRRKIRPLLEHDTTYQ